MAYDFRNFRLLPFDSLRNWLSKHEQFILLESALPGRHHRYSYIFHHAIDSVEIHGGDPQSVRRGLTRLATVTESNYAAGYVEYETGYALHPKLYPCMVDRPAVIHFRVYKEPVRYDHLRGEFNRPVPLGESDGDHLYTIDTIRPEIEKHQYVRSIERIRKHIERGYTYQVNFTTKLNFNFSGSPLALYAALRRAQPTAYCALIRERDKWILSFSPELFFKIENGIITARPMKGTMPRGRTHEEDDRIAQRLKRDEKNRAENVMIVDLLRNDIGRLAVTGSVHVPSLFDVERYPTVFQMTSTIEAILRNDVSWLEVFSSLFPCGSVTGAPKLRTMQIIRELEPQPRGIYTGALGFFAPDGKAVFNIPIRTIELSGTRGSMGIGSGIVWDSDPEAEYEECLLKAQFLTHPAEPLILIESLRYERGYHRLDLHLNRLVESAHYFGIPIDEGTIRQILKDSEKELKNASVYKVRLAVDENGVVDVQPTIIDTIVREPVLVRLSDRRTSSSDRFLYHKTNRRSLYEQELAAAQSEGYFDVIFQNERGEITEGAISNIYIKRDGLLYTPPVDSGVLPGVYRRTLLSEGIAVERVLTYTDLQSAHEIYVSNSVRGLLRAQLGY